MDRRARQIRRGVTCCRQKVQLLHHTEIVAHSGVRCDEPVLDAVDMDVFDGHAFSCRGCDVEQPAENRECGYTEVRSGHHDLCGNPFVFGDQQLKIPVIIRKSRINSDTRAPSPPCRRDAVVSRIHREAAGSRRGGCRLLRGDE